MATWKDYNQNDDFSSPTIAATTTTIAATTAATTTYVFQSPIDRLTAAVMTSPSFIYAHLHIDFHFTSLARMLDTHAVTGDWDGVIKRARSGMRLDNKEGGVWEPLLNYLASAAVPEIFEIWNY